MIETMNHERGSWGKVVGTIKDRLGLGPSRTEILEGEVIPEIFALTGQIGDLSSLSSTHQIEIPLPTNKTGPEPKKLKVASFTSLDLTNVIPNFERGDGEEVTLADVLLALRNSAGKDKMQVARRNVPQIIERFHGQDRYIITLNLNGKPVNISYITRRGFVKGAGALSLGAVIAACAGALRPDNIPPPQATLPPPGASIVLKPTPQEEAPSPDLPLRLVNVADAVPAFKNARDNVGVGQTLNVISFGADTTQTPNSVDGQDTTYLQVTKRTDTSYSFDRVHADSNDQTPISPISIDIQPNSVNVGLPFGSSEKLVETNGMVQIPDMNDPKTYDFIRNAVGLPPASKLFFAGGNEGAELRGHAILFGEIDDANPTEVKSWVVMPWLTQKGVTANIKLENGIPMVVYSGQGSGNVELLKLLVTMSNNIQLEVSSDGRYVMGAADPTKPRFPIADAWRKNGVPEEVISYYENLFVPPVLNEPWASNKETLQVQPENIFPIVGGINHANRYAIDMAMGSMKLVVKQSLDLTLTANHDGIRGTLGLALDNNAEFKAQAMKVRASIAGTDYFKGKKDYSDLTLVVEAGVVTMAVLKVGSELKRYRVDKDGTVTLLKKEEEPQLLPELMVDGPLIKRADTGEVVELKGVNVTDFAYSSNGSFANIYERGLKTVIENDWNINLLRVGINTEYIAGQLGEFDKLVKYAEEHGMYVMLVPHMEGDNQPYLPPPDTADIMKNLAQRYKQSSSVMYSLFNEPVPEDQIFAETAVWSYYTSSDAINKWRKIAQPIADAIRSVNPQAIVVVPGHSRWGREVHDYIREPFKINGSIANIVYDIHWYDAEDNDYRSRINWNGMTEFIDMKIAPVIFGEFGGAVTKNLQSPHDIDFIRKIIIMVNEHPGQLHYTVWALDTYARGGAILAPPNYTQLLPKGDLLLKDINGELLSENGKEYGTIPTTFTH